VHVYGFYGSIVTEGVDRANVFDIIRKNIFFGFYESFILFIKFAIFNCDLVFFFP
jgi:hypothetical protein